MIFIILLSTMFHQTVTEVFLDQTDLQMTCNMTRLMVALNVDPITIVEKTSDVMGKVFGLQSLDSNQDLMTNNIERMMVTALMMEFLPDLAHWKPSNSQLCKQAEVSQQDPVSQSSTYKIDISNKGKAKSGITSSMNMVATQRGVVNGIGKSAVREAVSKMEVKKSDVTTRFTSIDINTAGSKDAIENGFQIFNTAVGILVEIPTFLSLFASALGGRLSRENLWKQIGNSSSLTTILGLDPIAVACRNLNIPSPLNSTDPDTWWQGIDAIRTTLATADIELSYTQRCNVLD